ncbi:MAG: DMT family transporter [Anaeromicrobium sp.]|jgi:drug/metabolite transporter (DMT)-like permease|uniref:DMT family transporter n=1 Tax=Anaeromicrobium sp. TaxID=1929132 RepID=UPI0025DFCA40|nr:DMT family transporter [Anaeromicrobium sp.]MCT4593267.1 DMT family transporter [Anaeromicrobium sp.]
MTDKNKGIMAMIISALGFAIMGGLVKLIGDIPVIQKSLFRNGVTMIITFIMIIYSKVDIREIKHHKLLLLRSSLGTIGILLNYYAIDNLILSDANIIGRLSTFLVIIFCFIFLKEKVSFKQIGAIIVAFIGVLFIVKPQLTIRPAYIVAILGAVAAALAYTVLRVVGQKEHYLSIVMYFSTFSTLVLLPYVIFNFVEMSGIQIIYSILAGVGACVGQYGLTVAYKYAPAKEISIYNYFGVIFSAIFSMVIFEQYPDILSIIGYLIIFGGSLFMFLDKRYSS